MTQLLSHTSLIDSQVPASDIGVSGHHKRQHTTTYSTVWVNFWQAP